MECRRKDVNNSYLATLSALGLIAGLTAVPEIGNFFARVDAQEALIADLQKNLAKVNVELCAVSSEMDIQAEQLMGSLLEMGSLESNFQAYAASMEPTSAETIRESLRQDILSPVFQLSGGDAVGSAVLVYQGTDEDGPHYLALSCYHVVRDILASSGPMEEVLRNPVDCLLETASGESVKIDGRMVAENIAADLALIRLNTDLDLGKIAQLAPRQRAKQVKTFDPVYTVGCPLGTASQATHGEVTRTQWDVDSQPYWMVSSPAYFGNSGGGVFLEDTHELIGIFAKIYTHGSYRPQVITHMGLAVPLEIIHDWAEACGYGHILPQSEGKLSAREASHL